MSQRSSKPRVSHWEIRRRRRAGRRSSVYKLTVEMLEERRLLATVPAGWGELPLAFEVNAGQIEEPFDYVTRGTGYDLALSATTAKLSLQNRQGGDVLRMRLADANDAALPTSLDQLGTRSNYLVGNDPSQWHTDLANYGRVVYDNVYPGIDLVYYGNQGALEYDFVLEPHADPGVIRWTIDGAESIRLDDAGNLRLTTDHGEVTQAAPVLYQERDGVRVPVVGQFELGKDGSVGFHVGDYDPASSLVIDPILSYSSYFGSDTYGANAIAVDGEGQAYITGQTGTSHVYVAKFNATGTELVYSTILGGNSSEGAYGIAVDALGQAFLTGWTTSSNFPLTASAFQAFTPLSTGMAFVTQLNPSGAGLLFSSYLGSRGTGYSLVDAGQSIALDAAGHAYIAGYTSSDDFLTTAGAYQAVSPTLGWGIDHAFVAKIDPTQSGLDALVYSTYLGGSSYDGERALGIAVDSAGQAYVTGSTQSTDFPTTAGAVQTTLRGTESDAFVTKLDAAGSALVFSTYLGGGLSDVGRGIAIDASGNAFVTGRAYSADFPTTAGAFQVAKPTRLSNASSGDAFVTKISAAGTALRYSTYLGGNDSDDGLGLAVDADGNAYVIGLTVSANFPVTSNAPQTTLAGGYDAFVTKLDAQGAAVSFSSYLGGSLDDFGVALALDADRNVYLTGSTDSTNFPTSPDAYDRTAGSAFVAKLVTAPTLSISDARVIEGNSGATLVQLSVTLLDGSSQTVTVDYATVNDTATAGADYAAQSGTLSFGPGVVQQTITLQILGDLSPENAETFRVRLENAAGAQLVDAWGLVTIRDDDATKFFVVNDAATDRTYEYAEPGNSIENYPLATGNSAPRGAASTAAGNKVWVIDANKTVYVYDPTGAILGSWTAGSLNSTAQAEGIATNGTDIWIVDGKSDKVFRYAGAATRLSGSQNAASNFPLNSGNKDPKDLVTDGTSLWVVNNSTTDKVFKYSLSGSLLGSWTLSTSGASSPTGITLDPANPSHLWIVDNASDRVYQYDNAVGKASGSQAASASFTLAAGNTNPQGIADPPVSDEQTISGESFGSSSIVPALYDFALAQLLTTSPARSTADAAPTSREKFWRVPDRLRCEDPVVAIASGNPAPASRPKPAGTAGTSFERGVDAALAEWDRDESLAFLLL